MQERILIPNADRLIESLRSIGYSFETAVADIVDNSVYAKCMNIWINFNAYVQKPYLLIFDDGFGMNESELENSMIYGAKNPNEIRNSTDLGRFGLGMKSASLSQCREMIVISKKDNINAYSWDLDYVIKEKKWVVKKYDDIEIENLKYDEIEKLKQLKSGTIVVWRKFDRFSAQEEDEKFQDEFLKKIQILRGHLELVFHRFMDRKNEGLNIYLNDSKLEPVDPFLTNNKATQWKPTQIMEVEGEKIEVKPYILPHLNKIGFEEMAMLGGKESLRNSQGYYIYRNNRLIIWGKWFGQHPKSELQKLVRVKVDIPNSLDRIWEIDVKKSTAVLPYSIKRNLGLTINRALEEGKRVFRYRGRKKNDAINFEFIWDRIDDRGKISYMINKKHPIIKGFYEKSNDDVSLDKLFSIIEDYLPIQQIYNDHAENRQILNIENNDDSYEKAKRILSVFSVNEIEAILNNPTKIEILNLTDNEIYALRKELLGGGE